ncbi:hypothetical protein HYU92_06085 [Candidatus Curtissbacteria bacterium]|nr:hypothetical protein [Candidatus Curtissbacteria bacterium]
MKLYEFEGHRIFSKVGIESPFFVVCEDIDQIKQARKRLKFPIVAKVQVLAGGRSKGGGIKVCTTEKQLVDFAKSHFDCEFYGEKVRFIILAQKVEIEKEQYISINYDTLTKTPFILFSEGGGVEIEELSKNQPDLIRRIDIDPNLGPSKKELLKNGIPYEFAMRLWDAFWRYDCRLVEVNPLAPVKQNVILEGAKRPIGSRGGKDSIASLQNDKYRYVAVDAKIILDDSGLLRHRDLDVLPKGAISAVPTERELVAKQIDAEDYRGSAGSVFIELDGSPRSLRSPRGEAGGEAGGEARDIAILASGGGASLLVMDAVVAAGGAPANYTEYSGNPPAEKVEKLTKITLSRAGLSGCLVAGAVANFTDIYETLSGFARGLVQIKPKPQYPIVIRRGGPRQAEAYEMLEKVAKKEGFDIHLFGPETPISVACEKMVELSEQYKIRNMK